MTAPDLHARLQRFNRYRYCVIAVLVFFAGVLWGRR